MAATSKELGPLEGEFYRAKSKKFNETVVFVPFFGGTKSHMIRHVRLVNQLGYDSFAFSFTMSKLKLVKKLPLSDSKRFGLEHIWADEVRKALDFVSGPKIIFSFSNPTASALEAMTIPNLRSDVKALICDGGPFQNLMKCTWNLAKEEFGFNNIILRSWASSILYLMWSPTHKANLNESLLKLPQNFPVLSIRAWKDKLVPVSAIENAFEGVEQISLEVLELPRAGHLTGLRDCYDEYKSRVSTFLKDNSTSNSLGESPNPHIIN